MPIFPGLYRSFVRDPLFTMLNVGGLALGIAVFLVLTLYVRHERSYDLFPGSDRLWIVQGRHVGAGQMADAVPRTMGGELDLLRADFPAMIGARYEGIGGTVRTKGPPLDEAVVLVDPEFFNLFAVQPIAGDPVRALAQPGNVVVTPRVARRWFGTEAPIGRMLRVNVSGKEGLYRIAAIVADATEEQNFRGRVFLRLDRDNVGGDLYDRWDNTVLFTFLSFPSARAAAAFEQRLPAFLARHAFSTGQVKRDDYRQALMPLARAHGYFTGADQAILASLLGVGGLTLAIAILNYVNLATAQSGRRAREVAMRKVLGATRAQLVAQFMGEAVATAGLAVLIGLSLAELALPWLNALGGAALVIRYHGLLLLALPALVLGVGFVAGFYPAILLSRHQPAQVLAAARAPGDGRAGTRLRQGLVAVQFGVAICFAVVTTVILAQVGYLARADIGFPRDGLLLAEATDWGSLDRPQAARLLAGLRALPGVSEVTTNDIAPGWMTPTRYSGFTRADDPRRVAAAALTPVGKGYFGTYRSRLLAGRLFDDAHGADAASIRDGRLVAANVVINRTALHALGFARAGDAIDRTLRGDVLTGARIIGVIADMRFGDPRKPVPPIVYACDPRAFGSAFALRFDGGDPRTSVAAVERRWRHIAPNVAFQVHPAGTELAYYAQADQQRAHLIALGTMLAAAISCTGLYGLAAFDTARRAQEIGIRKTLGASTADIMRLLLGGFLRPVLLANVMAWPLAFVAARRWLAGFDDPIALSPWFFLAPSVAALVIAAATIVVHSWRSALAEPARALRHA